jgi:hypothetical protein
MISITLLFLSLIQIASVFASPIYPRTIFDLGDATGQPTVFAVNDISRRLVRPAQLARAAYCESASLRSRACGPTCDAINDVRIIEAAGGAYFLAPSVCRNRPLTIPAQMAAELRCVSPVVVGD